MGKKGRGRKRGKFPRRKFYLQQNKSLKMMKRKNSGNFALLGKYDDDSDRWLSVTTSTFRKRKKSREREKYIGWLAG